MEALSKRHLILKLVLVALVLSGAWAYCSAAGISSERWTDQFNLPGCAWSSKGKNDFFILEPGYQQILEGHEGKDSIRLEITVLDQTRKVGSIETRIVEERESRNGEVVEVSRNFFAACRPSNDIFYFGEDVDIYEDGKVATHVGAWEAEKGGARAGLFMPSRPLLGARFYQEIAPGVAMDRSISRAL